MAFYHASADIQRPLMDGPCRGAKGLTTPTGQVTHLELNIFQQDVVGINVYYLLCSKTVTVLYELKWLMHSAGLIMGDQLELSVVKTCNYL